jgi:primosomal protein N' (replication factor Y)
MVLGPAPAPMALLRGRHRIRLLMKVPRAAPIQRLLQDWVTKAPPPRNVRLQIDIDPYSFN